MKKQTRYTFEEIDFAGSGQLVTRNYSHKPNGSDGGWLSTATYKVGWFSEPQYSSRLVGFIAMSDGCITTFESVGALVTYLNEDDSGYHPTTQAEMRAINDHQGHRFSDPVANGEGGA